MKLHASGFKCILQRIGDYGTWRRYTLLELSDSDDANMCGDGKLEL